MYGTIIVDLNSSFSLAVGVKLNDSSSDVITVSSIMRDMFE